METPTLNCSLVDGTAGQYAVAWSEGRKDWLICRIAQRPGEHPQWVWVDADPDENRARRIAYLLYVMDLGETDL